MPSRSIIRTGVGPHREPRNPFPAIAAAINLLAARAARVQSRRNLSRSLSPKLDHSHSITRFDRSRTGPKWTGRLGACIATSGPGGIHLLNGLYDAKLDGQPVIAITGLQHHDLLHTYTQQDVELDKLFMDVCVYNGRVMGPAHTQNVVELACRTALAYRGVAHVTMPVDTQSEKVSSDHRSERNIPDHVSDLMAESAHMPTEDQLARAAAILNEGKKIVVMAGRGALNARAEVEAVAERLGAPVVKPLLGKGVLPD